MIGRKGVVLFIKAFFNILSDIRAKTDVKPVRKIDVEEFLNGITGVKYRYKGKKDKQGGVIAQDLEKSEMGKGMVHENEDGLKEIDANQLLGGIAASVGNINDRLRKIESRRGAK